MKSSESNKYVKIKKNNCCGCGACLNICPKSAISMKEDENGFLYPMIDEKKCINCGACKKICAYQNDIDKKETIKTYVASSKNKHNIINSASGGVFFEIAERFLDLGGICYGCAMIDENDNLNVKHIRISEKEELKKTQGSKYVQSNIINIFKILKKDLLDGKKVLFSGTPCQVAAIKKYIPEGLQENLYTIDIICHGVPNLKMFNEYLKILEKKFNGKIYDFKFRDKEEGWGLTSSVYYTKNGIEKHKIIPSHLSSYYTLFLKSYIYRENCYECKYATKERIGDITIGDFWGVEIEHKELFDTNKFELNNGVSCALINTNKGFYLIENYANKLNLEDSSFDKVAKYNKQLSNPSNHNIEIRNKIFELYRNGGYNSVEKWFYNQYGMKKYLYFIWNKLPRKVQKAIKKKKKIK